MAVNDGLLLLLGDILLDDVGGKLDDDVVGKLGGIPIEEDLGGIGAETGGVLAETEDLAAIAAKSFPLGLPLGIIGC